MIMENMFYLKVFPQMFSKPFWIITRLVLYGVHLVSLFPNSGTVGVVKFDFIVIDI